MDYKLARAIVETVTYYDVMNYPMTSFEVWRHLIAKDSHTVWTYMDVRTYLHQKEVSYYISCTNGFYTLSGREFLVSERRRRERISHDKIKKLSFFVRFLRFVPFVRGIGMTGRLSMKNAEESSDLDVLVVLSDGHMWLGRIVVTLFLHVIGMRRHDRKQEDRICLNYYMSDAFLEVPTKDLFAPHEYGFIVPLYGEKVFEKFFLANTWIREYRPHFISKYHGNVWMYEENKIMNVVRSVVEYFLSLALFESIAKKYQYKKIISNPKSKIPGAMIIANDRHLVFLPKPHGPEVFEEYQKRLQSLELSWPQSF